MILKHKTFESFVNENYGLDSLKKLVGLGDESVVAKTSEEPSVTQERRDFKIKTEGEDVKVLQTALEKGFAKLSRYGVDSIYGAETSSASKAFLTYIKNHHPELANGVSLDVKDNTVTIAQQDLIINLSKNENLVSEISKYFSDASKKLKETKIPYYKDLKKNIVDPMEFVKKTTEIANKLQTKPEYLLFVMWKESKYKPTAVNKKTNATGLIQFIPSTAEGLKTSVSQIYNMSGVEQLDYVYEFYKNATGKLNSLEDLYLYTFFPIALGKPDDWVLHAKNQSAPYIASLNKVVDLDGSGEITVGEFKKYASLGIPPNMGIDDSEDKNVLA
jgi:peptidoglycan hydrolase-like protein with peptidoglycan-binding domain